LIARAMTSAARTIEPAASSIMSSLAHGRIAEMSVGLIAVAVHHEPDGGDQVGQGHERDDFDRGLTRRPLFGRPGRSQRAPRSQRILARRRPGHRRSSAAARARSLRPCATESTRHGPLKASPGSDESRIG
jgi:hypothetical protein